MPVKTGISLPDDVYRRLLELVRAMGYTSVSRAVRDAIDAFIAFNRWWLERGPVMGTLQVVTAGGEAAAELARVEAEYRDVVVASLRVLTGGYQLHVIVVRGPGSRVKELYRALVKLREALAVQPALLPAPA